MPARSRAVPSTRPAGPTNGAPSKELRLALRRYRSFFDRLLAI
jgi:hypothetical protein